jgi:hypothetical protein
MSTHNVRFTTEHIDAGGAELPTEADLRQFRDCLIHELYGEERILSYTVGEVGSVDDDCGFDVTIRLSSRVSADEAEEVLMDLAECALFAEVANA